MALGEEEGHRERESNQTLPLSHLCVWLHWLESPKLLPIIKHPSKKPLQKIKM